MPDHSSNAQSPQIHVAELLAKLTPALGLEILPSIPISLATRLRLEMLVMRSSVLNLREITDTILRDPGATLQLMRVVEEEYQNDEGRPTRIEHCIALMNHERWYRTVCSEVIGSQDRHILDAWKQFRRKAHYTREAAMRIEGFCPEEAYLVGLLHQLGKLPYLLGWTSSQFATDTEECAMGILLAQSYSAPRYLIEALREQQLGKDSRWNILLRSAQEDSERHLQIQYALHLTPCATSFIC